MGKTRIGVYIDDELCEKLREMAKRSRRNLSGMVELLIGQAGELTLTMYPPSGDWHLTSADACNRKDPEKRKL